MKCTIREYSLQVFCNAVHCLAKIGEEIVIECTKKGLSLSTVNSAQSTYASFNCKTKFFETYKGGVASSNHGNSPSCYKVMTKFFLSIFRSKGMLEKVDKCIISTDEDSYMITVTFYCKYNIVKTRQIGYDTSDSLKAIYNKTSYPNTLSGDSRHLSEALVNFPPSLDEITFTVQFNHLLINNALEYNESSSSKKRIPLTKVRIPKEPFDHYNITKETSVTFCTKELKSILGFAESLEETLSLWIESPGSPVVLSIDNKELYSIDVVIASLLSEDEMLDKSTDQIDLTTAMDQVTSQEPYSQEMIDQSLNIDHSINEPLTIANTSLSDHFNDNDSQQTVLTVQDINQSSFIPDTPPPPKKVNTII
jgi:hypothetical protein